LGPPLAACNLLLDGYIYLLLLLGDNVTVNDPDKHKCNKAIFKATSINTTNRNTKQIRRKNITQKHCSGALQVSSGFSVMYQGYISILSLL
jgi:hypothetical protein